MPKDFEAIILKSMSKEPEQRYQSAEEFAAALEAFARGAGGAPVVQQPPPPVVAPPVTPPQPTTPPPPPKPAAPKPAPSGGGKSPVRHPLFLVGMGLTIIGLAAGIPLIALQKLMPGFVVLGLLPIGVIFIILAFVFGSKGGAPAKPVCPKCGRALLAGMSECPFCKPAAPGPAGPVPTIVPTSPLPPMPPGVPLPPGVGPGGAKGWSAETLNQSYHPLGGAPPPPMPVGTTPGLHIVDGADKGKSYPLTPNGAPVIIGRAAGITVTLNDPGVSSQHCSITFDGGHFVLQDLGSRNGCFVNNQKVQRHVLSAGDLVVVGSTRLLVNLAR
jgi:hypothetical protein